MFSDPQPTCSYEIKEGTLNASCSIRFRGHWPPVIEWSNPMGPMEASEAITIPNHSVTRFVIVKLNEEDPQTLYPLTCSVMFKEENKPPETTATNIPKVFIDVCGVAIKDPG